MTFFGSLYKLFIGPLELFFEILFVIANKMIDNLGLSIIVLSLVMNFLVLPLYKRADAMQEEQRETEKKLKKWVTHIKKNFKGDERFMMLQTYYRQNNYKPTSILKGSVSLLLEIPFFIAAYNFLSHAGVFDGFSFGPFVDLGRPDGLIKISGYSINLLPILMTSINIVSSMIYTKGLPVSSKVQLYGMAGIFLILLYDSPSALVFYWTLNNLFSLVKNIFYKLKNPGLVLGIISTIAGLFVFIFVMFISPFDNIKKQIFVVGISLLLQLPLLFQFIKPHIKKQNKVVITKNQNKLFWFSVVFTAILTGLLIPSALIHSSPEEFINTVTFESPLVFVFNTFFIAVGVFVIWFGIFYKLASDSGKKIMVLVVSVTAVAATINYMFFGKNLGTLSSFLIFDKELSFSIKEIIINILTFVLICIAVYFIVKRKTEILSLFFIISSLVFVSMSVYNSVGINKVIKSKQQNLIAMNTGVPSLEFSRKGKNVIVMMMDRAINSYIPYIFNERPDVAEQFEGFTYFPNTISYGAFTNTGSPALYGGYEYTPEEINKRDNESLESKQNESLKIMPVIFDQNDFNVTVCDPTYAGYDWIPDLSIYDDYPDIKKYITMGRIQSDAEQIQKDKSKKLNRDFFLYSVFKTVLVPIQEFIYDEGNYNCLIKNSEQIATNIHEANGIYSTFMESYLVLKNLHSITDISDSEENNFIMISNDTTHSPCLLKEPEYEPAEEINNKEYDESHKARFNINGKELKMENVDQVKHYQVNMAAMIQLGNYFDYLRKENVYDNTRIIIVADHGRHLGQNENMIFGEARGEDAMLFNPLLMVKDFNSDKFTTNYDFMTNADVPTLAFDGLVEKPVNPFTNKEINNDKKLEKEQHIFLSFDWDTDENNGTTFLPGSWYSVHDNIFDKNNWERIE